MAELKIKADSGGGTVAFKGPATTTGNAAVQLTLPVNDGDASQYLQTNGSGVLSWATVSSTPEGTAIKSTGESGGTKFLREDGDNTCSWQSVPAAGIAASHNGVAKAWVTFSADGNTIRDHFNIASVTDHATGDFEFFFDTDFANINWCMVNGLGYNFNPNASHTAGSGFPYIVFVRNRNVGSVRVEVGPDNPYSNGLDDTDELCLLFFGDQ